jgi:DNA mismatch repair ATPase MutS
MDVLLDKSDSTEIPSKENEIVYLYKYVTISQFISFRLVPGKVTPSYGIVVAAHAGIPSEILVRIQLQAC